MLSEILPPSVSYPRSTLDLAYRGAQALQGWIMNDTSLSLPAIVQCEGTPRCPLSRVSV